MSLWLLGGHDPTHGAGLYRDLITARSLAPALPRWFAVTAMTEQGRGRPARAWSVPADRLRARVSRWPRPTAIKIGLVPDALAADVATLVRGMAAPVVVDPVLRASDGGSLGATAEGLAPLLTVATVITPNRSEAHALLGGVEWEPALGSTHPTHPTDEPVVHALGRRFGHAAVLLKDGHGSDLTRVHDRLIQGSRVLALTRPRRQGPDPRGTGCALATAVAVHLAQGEPVDVAVRRAIAWLDRARLRWIPGPDGRAHLPDYEPTKQ
ncbi:MAG: bifunctional hydroxymethylpyrimidine kinase/phosphomethylpyrimidine kinase [Myxococcota bacterium]